MDSNYFTVTPMTQTLLLDAGESYTGKVTIINPVNAENDFDYEVYVAPYGVIGENYDADLTTESSYTRIKDWIKIDEPTGTIKPNGVKDVYFTIKVPDTAPAGGQYAAIVVRNKVDSSSEQSISVKNIFEMASLLYADISGEIVHKGEILGNDIPAFVVSEPITVGSLISNEGNVHEYATIYIKANNFFTGEVIVSNEGETGYYTELIMPETTRYIQRDISQNLPLLGVVHVEQTISYNGQYSKQEKDVIICPIWFMFLVLAVIGMIVFTITRLIMKHKKKAKIIL